MIMPPAHCQVVDAKMIENLFTAVSFRGTIVNRTKILLIKKAKSMGFRVCRRSYLICPPAVAVLLRRGHNETQRTHTCFRACACACVFRGRAEGVGASGGLSRASGSQAHGGLPVDGGVVPQRPGGRPLRAAGASGDVS